MNAANFFRASVAAACIASSPLVAAQPPGGGGGGGGGAPGVECPTTSQFDGDDAYIGKGPKAAPVRGNVGCVDLTVLATRPTAEIGGGTQTAQNIYGPMEAGFTKTVPGMTCLGSSEVPGGVDTNLAEHMVAAICTDTTVEVLDSCGGHAIP